MTKKELELENKFLKSQLKLIDNVLNNISYSDREDLIKKIAQASYYCSDYEDRFDFIKKNNKPYNYYGKDIEIN